MSAWEFLATADLVGVLLFVGLMILARHNDKLDAQALEAGTGETRNGARSRSDDIAVREADAPNPSSLQNKAPIHEG